MDTEDKRFDAPSKEQQNENADKTIPVIEEQLRVDKKESSRRVTIKKVVHEEQVPIDTQEFQEQVNVKRKKINQVVDTPPPATRQEGDVTIVPVLREEVVVQKRLVLVEELHITKQQNASDISRSETIRKEEVVIVREEHSSVSDKE